MANIIGYCLKCKIKQPMSNVQKADITMKTGRVRRAAKGICPVCETKMYKILSITDVI